MVKKPHDVPLGLYTVCLLQSETRRNANGKGTRYSDEFKQDAVAQAKDNMIKYNSSA